MIRLFLILTLCSVFAGCAEDRSAVPEPEPTLDDGDPQDGGFLELDSDAAAGPAGLPVVQASLSIEVEHAAWPDSVVRFTEATSRVTVESEPDGVVISFQNLDEIDEFESFQFMIPSEVADLDLDELASAPRLKGRESGTAEPAAGTFRIEQARGDDIRFLSGEFQMEIPVDDQDGAPTYQVRGAFEISYELQGPGD